MQNFVNRIDRIIALENSEEAGKGNALTWYLEMIAVLKLVIRKTEQKIQGRNEVRACECQTSQKAGGKS